MQRQLGVALGAVLGLVVVSGAEAAPRDGRPVLEGQRHGATARTYAAPAVRAGSPAVHPSYVAGQIYGRAVRGFGYGAGGARAYGIGPAYGARAVAPGWSAAPGSGYGAGGYAQPGWAWGAGYGSAPNYAYGARPYCCTGAGPGYGSGAGPSNTYAVGPSWGYGGQSSPYLAAPAVGYAAVPYPTGPAYGYITAPAYGRPYAADPVFGYYPVLDPW